MSAQNKKTAQAPLQERFEEIKGGILTFLKSPLLTPEQFYAEMQQHNINTPTKIIPDTQNMVCSKTAVSSIIEPTETGTTRKIVTLIQIFKQRSQTQPIITENDCIENALHQLENQTTEHPPRAGIFRDIVTGNISETYRPDDQTVRRTLQLIASFAAASSRSGTHCIVPKPSTQALPMGTLFSLTKPSNKSGMTH